MALGATVTTYTTQTVISSSATNTNLSNINAVETPTFTTVKQTAGTQETGYCGIEQSNGLNTGTMGQGVNYKVTMTNTPSSLSFSVLLHSNAGSETAGTLRAYGFFLQASITSGATNAVTEIAYTTVGN